MVKHSYGYNVSNLCAYKMLTPRWWKCCCIVFFCLTGNREVPLLIPLLLSWLPLFLPLLYNIFKNNAACLDYPIATPKHPYFVSNSYIHLFTNSVRCFTFVKLPKYWNWDIKQVTKKNLAKQARPYYFHKYVCMNMQEQS